LYSHFSVGGRVGACTSDCPASRFQWWERSRRFPQKSHLMLTGRLDDRARSCPVVYAFVVSKKLSFEDAPRKLFSTVFLFLAIQGWFQ